MNDSGIKYFIIVSQLTSIVSVMAGKVAAALADRSLNFNELVDILEVFRMNLRMMGLSSEKIDMIKIETEKYKFNQIVFEEGDLVVYVPKALTEELKINT